MKKTVSAILVIALLSAWLPFALGETGLRLRMDLDGAWQERGTGYNEGVGKIYMHRSGAMLVVAETTTEIAVGKDMYQQLYNTGLWPSALKYVLNGLLKAYGSAGDPFEVPMGEGIFCCAANAEVLGLPAVAAVVQYENDLWFIICMSENSASARSLFESVCGSITLGEARDEGGRREQADYSDGYFIPEVPVTVHLDDRDLNIYTQDTPADSLTMQRTERGKATMDWYVAAQNAKLIITYPDRMPTDFMIEIRVKDDKYASMTSWDKLGEEEIALVMDKLYGNQVSSYTVYKTDTATFTVFSFSFDVNALRYVTIKNGDIIYVHMKRSDGPLTDEDHALIRRVVDSMEFADR